ncbi:MAG: peroxiredoxin [Patescibacteria group bacterium]|nr:peroxiredoxin [Patescibacteria group bacterium]
MLRRAPNFSLPDQNGFIRSKKDYAGKWLVLFFYPKDRSLNCTRQVCAFRDESVIIGQFGNAEIVGVNHESIASHKSFATRKHLNFPLLSDEDYAVTKAYGAYKTNRPKPYDLIFSTRRNTYLIDPAGNIVKEYLSITPGRHAQEVISDLHELQKTTSKTV